MREYALPPFTGWKNCPESPAGIPRRWNNKSRSAFRVLVVKVPRSMKEMLLLEKLPIPGWWKRTKVLS
ncbi:MAG: hypothetical protein NQU46_08625 [Methanolinea sp.]|nr:hypothetical protein [Methanolinea sp.]